MSFEQKFRELAKEEKQLQKQRDHHLIESQAHEKAAQEIATKINDVYKQQLDLLTKIREEA